MGEITEFFLADGMGAFVRKFIRNCAEMAYAGANHLERLDDILAQGNDAESKRRMIVTSKRAAFMPMVEATL